MEPPQYNTYTNAMIPEPADGLSEVIDLQREWGDLNTSRSRSKVGRTVSNLQRGDFLVQVNAGDCQTMEHIVMSETMVPPEPTTI